MHGWCLTKYLQMADWAFEPVQITQLILQSEFKTQTANQALSLGPVLIAQLMLCSGCGLVTFRSGFSETTWGWVGLRWVDLETRWLNATTNAWCHSNCLKAAGQPVPVSQQYAGMPGQSITVLRGESSVLRPSSLYILTSVSTELGALAFSQPHVEILYRPLLT